MTDGVFDYVAARWSVFGLRREGERVIDVPGDLRPLERLVLLAMIEHAPEIAPSVARLVTMTGLSRRAVLYQIQALERRGTVRTLRAHGTRSVYSLTLPDQCTACTSASRAPVQDVHGGSAPDAPLPVHRVHRSSAPRAPEAGTKRESKQEQKREGRNAPALALASPPQAPPPGKNGAKAPKPPKAPRAKARHAIPSDWAPTDAHRAQARELRVDLEVQARRFRDHAQATGRLMADWSAAFRTWLDKAPEFAARGGNGSSPTSSPGVIPNRAYTPTDGTPFWVPPIWDPVTDTVPEQPDLTDPNLGRERR